MTRRSRSRYEDEFDEKDGYTPGGEDDEDEEEAPPRGRRSRPAREEAPTSRRTRRSTQDDEEEAPRRSRRAARSEEPDEEEEAPRRSRRSRSEDDEEEAPRRSRRSARSEDDEEEAPRRSRRGRAQDDEEEAPRPRFKGRRSAREDDEEDEAPRRGRRSAKASAKPGRGWNAYADEKKKGGDFADTFTPSGELVLIKFIDEEPFDSYREHWVQELEGRKSRTCLGDECPLCEIGHQARMRVCFNIIDWSDAKRPAVKVWLVGVRLAEAIKNFAEQSKTAPLNKPGLYWSISRTGKGMKTDHHLQPVKSRDLDEDWERDPLAQEEIDELAEKAQYTPFSRHDAYDELAEVADQLDVD